MHVWCDGGKANLCHLGSQLSSKLMTVDWVVVTEYLFHQLREWGEGGRDGEAGGKEGAQYH